MEIHIETGAITNKDGLRDCMFCRSEKCKVVGAGNGGKRVKCCDCGAMGPIAMRCSGESGKAKAINEWNYPLRRA